MEYEQTNAITSATKEAEAAKSILHACYHDSAVMPQMC